MERKQKIAVIGQGFAGLSVALELIKKGYEVDIVSDSQKKPASRLALGIVSLKGLYRARQPEFAYKVKGFFCLIKQLRLLQQAFPEVCLYKSVYEPFFSKLDEQAKISRIYRFDDFLPASVKKLNREKIPLEVLELFGSTYYSSLFFSEDFFINVDKYLNILRKYVMLHGGKTVDKTFRESKKSGNRFQLCFQDGDVFGDYHQVVLCIGRSIISYPHLSHSFRSLLKESKGYILEGRYGLQGKAFGLIQGGKYLGVCDGSWKYGGFSENISSKNSFQNLSSFIPLFEPENISRGSRILTKIRTPMIEFSTIGEIIVTGLYKNGLQYAPLTAKKVGEKITSIN